MKIKPPIGCRSQGLKNVLASYVFCFWVHAGPILTSVLTLGSTFCCHAQTGGLTLTLVSKAPVRHLVASYQGHDAGKGNTSVAHDAKDFYKWSKNHGHPSPSWGYFDSTGREVPYMKRDRDLGQTFQYSEQVAHKLYAITLRTGYGSNAVRGGMYGKHVSIQVFEVSGMAILNDNGTGSSMNARHGFPHGPQSAIAPDRDDYFTGETFRSLAVFSGATFPEKKDFGFDQHELVSPDHVNLKGRYLTFQLPRENPVVLIPGKTYAFLVMIDSIGVDCGFALANRYYGTYSGGHGIRRDGNGLFPPLACDPMKAPGDVSNRKALESAHFPADFLARTSITPGTNGYPDVDTWRDIEFYIQANAEAD